MVSLVYFMCFHLKAIIATLNIDITLHISHYQWINTPEFQLKSVKKICSFYFSLKILWSPGKMLRSCSHRFLAHKYLVSMVKLCGAIRWSEKRGWLSWGDDSASAPVPLSGSEAPASKRLSQNWEAMRRILILCWQCSAKLAETKAESELGHKSLAEEPDLMHNLKYKAHSQPREILWVGQWVQTSAGGLCWRCINSTSLCPRSIQWGSSDQDKVAVMKRTANTLLKAWWHDNIQACIA